VPVSPSESGRVSHIAKIVEKFIPMLFSFRGRRYFATTLVGLCFVLGLWASLPGNGSIDDSPAGVEPVAQIWPVSSALDVTASGNRRSVFPYSVIAGGAESAQELREAVLRDPVVAQHYSDFNLASVRRVTLNAPQMMYVSYRIGNNVFWTKRKLALAKGESMLTDGRTMARTRCGNRVSALPVRPNALAEPSAEEFSAPEIPAPVSTPYLAAYSAPVSPFSSGPSSSPSPSPSFFAPVAPFFPLPGGGGGRTSTPPGGGVVPPGGGGTTPPGGGGGTPTPPGPPPAVPEPGTASLVLVGLFAISWLAFAAKKHVKL
jgi:hypothetical protein